MRKGFTRRPKIEEPTANHGKNYITPGGIERLKDERHFLLTKDRPAVVEVVAWAASNGDRSENADYQYSKRRLRQIDGRVRFLTNRIEAAEVVGPEAPRTGQRATRAFFGATVRYANATGVERVASIVGTDEVNLDRNHISWASPLGRAFMRAAEDDEVVVHAPGGTETMTVLEVRYERISVEPFHVPPGFEVSTKNLIADTQGAQLPAPGRSNQSASALSPKSAARVHWRHNDFLEIPVRKIFLMLILLVLGGVAVADAGAPVYNFKLSTIDGDPTTLGAYKGKVLLVVNVASACGFTPQYTALEAVYEKYKDKGLVIVGVPANNFGNQESGTNATIKEFCSAKFHVKFPMMAKVSVKGDDETPLYQYLTAAPNVSGEIKWNFTKFLIDRNGQPIARFEPAVTPDSPQVISAIESALKP